MVTGFILFGGIIFMGVGLLFFGLRELYRKFTRENYFAIVSLAAVQILIGLIFIIGGVFACIEAPKAEVRKIDFAQQCEDKGGTVLEPEDASGWQCWQNRIEIEGY